MYPEKMEIYATACDGFPECVNGEDERLCFDNTALYIILPSSMGFIAMMYLVLKFGRYIFRRFQKRNQHIYSFQLHLVSKIHKLYCESHGKVEEMDKINRLLLHIIFDDRQPVPGGGKIKYPNILSADNLTPPIPLSPGADCVSH